MKKITIFAIAGLTALLISAAIEPALAQTGSLPSERTESVNSKLSVLEVKPMQFRVSYHTPQSKSVSLRILDADKNVLFTESKKIEINYLKHFDLSSLSDGTYTFELTDGKEKFSQSFDVLTKTSRVVSSLN